MGEIIDYNDTNRFIRGIHYIGILENMVIKCYQALTFYSYRLVMILQSGA